MISEKNNRNLYEEFNQSPNVEFEISRLKSDLLYLNKIINEEEGNKPIQSINRIKIDGYSSFFSSLWEVATDPAMEGNRGKGNLAEYIIGRFLGRKTKASEGDVSSEADVILKSGVGISIKFYNASSQKISLVSYSQKIKDEINKEGFKKKFPYVSKLVDKMGGPKNITQNGIYFLFTRTHQKIKKEIAEIVSNTVNPNIFYFIMLYDYDSPSAKQKRENIFDFNVFIYFISPNKMNSYYNNLALSGGNITHDKQNLQITKTQMMNICGEKDKIYISFKKLKNVEDIDPPTNLIQYLKRSIESSGDARLSQRKSKEFPTDLVIKGRELLNAIKKKEAGHISRIITDISEKFKQFFDGFKKQFKFLKNITSTLLMKIYETDFYSTNKENIKNKMLTLNKRIDKMYEDFPKFKVIESIIEKIEKKSINEDLNQGIQNLTSNIMSFLLQNQPDAQQMDYNMKIIGKTMTKSITDANLEKIMSNLESAFDKYEKLIGAFSAFEKIAENTMEEKKEIIVEEKSIFGKQNNVLLINNNDIQKMIKYSKHIPVR